MYWLTGIVGFILLIAPFVFSYTSNTPALWASILIGGATIVVSFIEGVENVKQTWEYWTAEVLGVLAIIAPFLLGFTTHATAMWTSIVSGLLLIFFAGSKLFSEQAGKRV